MDTKQLLLCLGAGIPFGLWSYCMNRSGIQNPTVTFTLLFVGTFAAFLPVMNFDPQLKPGVTLTWAVGIALATGLLHGVGHRCYQYLIVNNGKDGINLATANVAMLMILFLTAIAANTFILGEPFTLKKGIAVVTGILTILLYA